jgi:hypothetical protein
MSARINAGLARTCIVYLTRSLAAGGLCVGVAPAQHWFQAARLTTEIVGYPTVNLGDFDHDGDVDLLGIAGPAVRAFVNDGTSYYANGAPSTLGAGELTSAHVLADFDADGELDLATVQSGASAGVRIHRGIGSGAFDAGALVALPIAPGALRAGQADADAARELGILVQNFDAQTSTLSYTVQWIDWNGATFQAGAASNGVVLNFGASDIECVDENGDARDDLVIASQNTLHTYRTGASALAAPQAAPTKALGMLNGTSSLFLLAADYDADGTRELVVYHGQPSAGYGCVALEPLAGGGWNAGPFQTPALNSVRAFAGDWDGDGDLDLATNAQIALNGGLRLVRNSGGTTFTSGASTSVVYVGLGAGLADLDLDGFLDFAGPGAQLYGNGTFDSVVGGAVRLPAYGGLGLPLQDLEGDGDLDQPAVGFASINDNSGVATTVSNWQTLPAQHFYGATVGFGDWDGDGRADWLVPVLKQAQPFFPEYLGTHLQRDDGNGHYVGAGLASDLAFSWTQFQAADPLSTFAFDVDQDGDLDLLQAHGWIRNNGAAYFDAGGALPGFGIPLRVGDHDGDGQHDVLALREGVVDELLLQAPGTPGVFQTTVLASSSATLLRYVSWNDLDGDGDRDIATTTLVGTNTYVPTVIPRVGGGYGAPIALAPVAAFDVVRLAAEDLDGDGYVELLAGSINSPLLLVYQGTATPYAYGALRQFHAGPVHSFEDLDEDGDLDVIGSTSVENLRLNGPAAGGAQQYGAGTAGSGGAVPLLGASGAFVPGSSSATLNLVRANGPAPTYLAVAAAAGSVPGFPLAGLTALIDPQSLLAIVQIPALGSGSSEGEWHLSINVTPGLAGNTFYHQVFAVDLGSPNLVAQSNGLEIRYGQ